MEVRGRGKRRFVGLVCGHLYIFGIGGLHDRSRLARRILCPMFTGIVQHLGQVQEATERDFGRRLVIDIAGWSHRPAKGDSIAVNGCCLTVAEPTIAGEMRLAFDVIAQTLRVTTLGSLAAGDGVNLEHAVTPATLLGGHIVQGHVDGVGRVLHVVASAMEHRIRIGLPEARMRSWIVVRGSIAVSGVSLTAAELDDAWFEVALIPTTLGLTNLGRLREGDRVNLEFDYVAKVVTNWLERQGGRSGHEPD